MSSDTRAKSDEQIRKDFLRSRCKFYNDRLDKVEEELMHYMRVDSWSAAEFTHCLIGERENIKATLKDLHCKIYE